MSEVRKKTPYCPLSMSNPNGSLVCLEENCAWWIASTRTCAAYVIAHNNILDIKQKQGK